MTQLSLLEAPRVDVYLACPSCGLTWWSAVLHPWGDKTAVQVAKRCYCVACECPPPMRVAKAQKASAA